MLSSKDSGKLPDTLEDAKSSDSHSDSEGEQKKAGEASTETKKLIIKFKVGSHLTFHRPLQADSMLLLLLVSSNLKIRNRKSRKRIHRF